MRYCCDMDTEFRTGYGRDWLDFAVTLLGRYTDEPRDLIETPAGLRAWLKAWHLVPGATVTDDDVLRAQKLRDALHGLARAAATERSAAPDDVRVLDEALADDTPVRVRRLSGALATSRPASAREALARLARQAVDDLTGPHPARLRACGDDECSGIFVDPTGRRRWCSDERCGVKARVRAHRARARASRSGS